MNNGLDVIIPVYRPDGRLYRLINRLNRQTVRPSMILLLISLDESDPVPECGLYAPIGFLESDLCVMEAHKSFTNVFCLYLPVRDFDHALTRQLGAEHTNSPYMLFMTQDALPKDRHLTAQLLESVKNNENIAAAYARQLPDADATGIERFMRFYNYPKKSADKSLADLKKLGIHTYFCSNVCAIYNRRIFGELGGFSQSAVFNEDMIFAAKAMNRLYHISYNASALVIHSHNHSLKRQFSRYFDNGASQAMNPELFAHTSSESAGLKLFLSAVIFLILKRRPFHMRIKELTEFCAFCIVKLLGFFLGKRYRLLPKTLIMKLTSNKAWWDRAL